MELGLEIFCDPADSRIDRLLWMPFRRLPQTATTHAGGERFAG